MSTSNGTISLETDRQVKSMKVVLVTNIPTPYRKPVFDRVADILGDNFTVIYCAKKEPIRDWEIDITGHNHIFLKENIIAKKDTYNFMHNNRDVWGHLRKLDPDVVITNGFFPTMLYAWMYTVRNRKKHIAFIDGWKYSESALSTAHRLVRKAVFAKTNAFLGPGKNTAELYKSYGAKDEEIFQSHLCADDARFNMYIPFEERKYDLLYAGRIHELKLPYLFVDTVVKVKEKLPDVKVLIIGNGPERDNFLKRLDDAGVDYDYPGFIQPTEIATYYANSRLLLFTTQIDAWGMVANEALAVGTPVITTPFAGVAHDLVEDGVTGYVLDPEPQIWGAKSLEILTNRDLWDRLSQNGAATLDEFNYSNAAKGFLEASKYALTH